MEMVVVTYVIRVLIIHNMAASTLWHKLMCFEPPAGLLKKVQSIPVKFLGQFAPQSVL